MADAAPPMGLIAGSGEFPLAFARAITATGRRLVVVAHQGETSRAIESVPATVVWIKLGQVGRILEVMKEHGCSEAVMLGAITKASFFGGVRPDMLGLKLLATVAVRSDDKLLRTLARGLEERGLRIVSSGPYLTALRAPEGVLGRAQPTDEERDDVRYGFELAKNLGRFDVGQTVVVKDRAPLALEALEGTDACIIRGGGLAKSGATVVKVVKPEQDERFDLPVAGSRTVEVCASHGVRVLAVEAGGTLLADREKMIKLADKANIVLMGVGSSP